MIETATAEEMRRCLTAAQAMKQARIRFVPMPVLSEADHAELSQQMMLRLEMMEVMAGTSH